MGLNLFAKSDQFFVISSWLNPHVQKLAANQSTCFCCFLFDVVDKTIFSLGQTKRFFLFSTKLISHRSAEVADAKGFVILLYTGKVHYQLLRHTTTHMACGRDGCWALDSARGVLQSTQIGKATVADAAMKCLPVHIFAHWAFKISSGAMKYRN